MTKATCHLGLFAKFWQSGRVKTRLAKSIGDDRACRLYRAFLFHLLDEFRGDPECKKTIVFAPSDREQEFRSAAGHDWSLEPQIDGSLGDRLARFFQSHLNSNQKLIVIGADCPLLSSEEVKVAFEKLDEFPVVVGPSHDGGYYLIGMRARFVDLFGGISWSTDQVLRQTIQKLDSCHVGFCQLPEREDIDDIEGLKRLQVELRQNAENLDERLLELLREIELATA